MDTRGFGRDRYYESDWHRPGRDYYDEDFRRMGRPFPEESLYGTPRTFPEGYGHGLSYGPGYEHFAGSTEPYFGAPEDIRYAHHGRWSRDYPGARIYDFGPLYSPSSGRRFEAGPYSSTDFTGRGPKNYRRADERIAEDIYERLTWNRNLDATEIDVQVKDHIVTLKGSVESRRAKRLAEDIADDVNGVEDVKNEIKILPPQEKATKAAPREESEAIPSSGFTTH